ncbi:MAG TPA: Vps62-related protein [Thermoanaerobaculia bacterium]|nr:Vps62-related protein [Thermoanaerobaculia bacterium]
MKRLSLPSILCGLCVTAAFAVFGHPSPAAAQTCDGIGDGTWNGCRGTGCQVCPEKVAGYDCYFINHPECVQNTSCGGLFYDCDAACPPPTEADICGNTNGDGDSMSDALEDELLWRFAPVVRLHPNDSYRPSSADWYMARTHMRFHHTGCGDDQILNKGQITTNNIDLQAHQNKNGWPGCSHNSTWQYSDMRTPNSRFFLQIPNDSAEGTTRLGAPSSDWTCYAHVRYAPGSTSQYDIQYWFFYPYNGALMAGQGGHEGDWEHITVRVWNDGTSLSQIYFASHDTEGQWFQPWQVSFTADDRPIVYSAVNSHASYPSPGTWVRNNLPDDHTADGGPVWDCRRGVWNVGERGLPLNKGRYWLNYSGRWGEIGTAFSGPWGPAYNQNNYWNVN